MSNQDLKNQIIGWLQNQPYWMQYLGNFLLESGKMNDETTAIVYRLFKEEAGLEPPGKSSEINFNKMVSEDVDGDRTLTLQSIKDIANVNALAEGQTIEIGSALTIIYGGNGTGKSGYVRLLNNAFSSRGEKEILPNVFKPAPAGQAECAFTFRRTEDPYSLRFPADRHSYEFAQFSVFDTKSVSQHLGGENQLSFVPSGFDFFEKLIAAQNAIRGRLGAEIDQRSKMHNFGPMFVNENDVSTFIRGLSAQTELGDVDKLCTLSEDDTIRLNELKARLEILKAADKRKQLDDLAATRKRISDFADIVRTSFAALGKAALGGYASAIETAKKFEELAKAEGIESFDEYDIAEIGSHEWQEFIRAGRVYAAEIESARGGAVYPSGDDHCLLCLQPLGDAQKVMIQAFWDLLKSNAQAELGKATIALAETELSLRKLPELEFGETSAVFQTVNECDPNAAARWKVLIEMYNKTRIGTLLAIGARDPTAFPTALEESEVHLDDCLRKLDTDRAALIALNPEAEMASLLTEIALFEDRLLLAKIRANVEAYLTDIKWAAAGRPHHSGLTPARITRISGSLYDKHVTDEYLAVFNEECAKLDAPNFVKIQQRNSRGSTLRRLQVEGTNALKILSEGEQRAIAIADFVTEARLDPQNRGLFFDDPVSSQDHERRENIASRLVELAKFRQVIIFTHDLAFLFRLLSLAECENVEIQENNIVSDSVSPGVIYSDVPWMAKKLSARIGTLKKDFDRLTKASRGTDRDEYERELKSWYGRLRDAWEMAVEERLLKGVIERFGKKIQTQKLCTIEVTPELLADIDRGMTNASQWLHDQAAGLNPKLPDPALVKQHLDEIETFSKKCKSA